MSAVKNRNRFAALLALASAVAFAGCGKKDEPTKAEVDPKPAEAPKEKKDGDITMDDLRAAAKAAGGDLDKPAPLPKPPESLAKVMPDVILTARAFWEETNKDFEFLLTKHAGKVVEVTGIVDEYFERLPGIAYLLLRGGDRKIFDAIRCDVREKELPKKVLPSQTVVLRIRVPRATPGTVALIWEIIEAKGVILTLTAEQFSREKSAMLADEFDKKYSDKTLIVTGVIAQVTQEDQGTAIFLNGVEKVRVRYWFPKAPSARIPFSQRQKDSLKPGQNVKLFGEYFSGNLGDCILLEPAP